MLSSSEEEERIEQEREAEGDEKEEEEEEPQDLRVWWMVRWVCQLLGYAPTTRPARLVWPEHPDHHYTPALVARFLDEAAKGKSLVFWQADYAEEDDDMDASPTGYSPPYPIASTAGTNSFSWKFDKKDEDTEDEENEKPGSAKDVHKHTSTTKMAGPLLHVQETAAPPTVGVPVVLAKKACEDAVPDMEDKNQAQELMPLHIHLTYLLPHTHHALHTIFRQVYVPLCERLGKNDRTSYLANLARKFSRVSKLQPPSPALDYDSQEEDEGGQQGGGGSFPKLHGRESMDGGPEERKEEVAGEKKSEEEDQEDQEKDTRSPRTLLLNNTKRFKEKFSQVGSSNNTLGDLRSSWSNGFLELSSVLAHLHAHPLMAEQGMQEEEENEQEGKEELKEAVVQLADLHTGLADCYKSLEYLEKFIKVVGEGQLAGLEGLAGSLMEVLLLLWRLGRRQGISGRVQVMLECGVESLVGVVTRELRPVNLLPASMREAHPFLASQRRVMEALHVVAEWEEAVMVCAQTVMASAKRQRDGRQDFDPTKVLGTISGLRSVCTDLSDIMKVLLEAQVGFSGEWSALIRVQDPDQLRTITSQVLRVLTAYDFNIFSARNQDRWVRQKEDLQLAVQKWEQAVISAINESFQDRMTSELVTAVAGVLQKEPCRASFRQLLISRLPDLLSAFAEEVKGIRADFKAEQEKERPGTQAPLSGRVRWMTAYLTKRLAAWTTLKQLYSQHQESSAGGDLWAEVEAEVEEVQGEVERAREQMVAQWGKRVTQQIPKLLVTPVLTRDKYHCGVGGWQVRLPGELQSVVWECGQLLQAGIRPPELATHLTLHYHTLQTAAMGLHLTLKDYHSVLDQLSTVQRELLSAELSGADRVLAAGQRVVTWSPAALTHFSTSCRDVIEHVRALANKLISITHHLDDHLTSIRETRLLNPAPRNTTANTQHPPSLPELMGDCKVRCSVMIEELVEVYERLVTTLGSAGLLLCSAEEGAPESLAAHIRTAPELKTRLSPFLLHWRHNVQEAVTMMLVNSISSMEKLLQGHEVVFGVESSLTSTSTLTLTPPARTLTSILADALGHTVRSAMVFRHWVELEDGTVALNPAPTADDDTLATSTFYNQVSQDPRLHAAIESITSTFSCVIRILDADLQSWYVYEHVWRRDKSATVNRFCRSGPSVKEYDDKLRFYTHLASELSQASQHKTHGCVSLDVRPLVGQVVRQAGEWVKLLGAGLLLEARNRLNHVLEQVTIINSELEQPTKDLASLTVVVRGVRQVTSQHAHLHTAILDVRQMFHTLSVYGIEVMDSDHRKLELTSEKLEVLHQNSITVKRSLQPTQAFFLAKTQQKVSDFSKAVQRFQQKFESKGPGSVGEDLERGVVLLKEYSKKVDELQKEREQLDQEEDVFDLPATQYPGLDDALVMMQQLREVFAIYQQLRSVEMTWRTMRWVTAKLDDLKGQVEGVRAALQDCDGGQETEVWRAMQQRLDDHTTSLEVTAALRQPAVQARHWQHLVTVTGCGGRWESSTGVSNVSVWDVLELRLSRHPLLVATTVDAAVRESHLNTQIKEIANFWQRTRLCVQTSTAVWTVEGLDDLLDHLHNHNLTLKAMANTRYCRPFAEEASRLAGTLVSVEALVEAWQDTQENVKLLLSHTLASGFSKAPELRARYRKLMERIERRAFVLELAGNTAFLEEVLVLQRYAQEVMGELGQVLESPRCQCARLHFLTNQELMALLAYPSPEQLNLLVSKLFNHVCGLRWSENNVKGLLTLEGEELHLLSPVVLTKDGDGTGVGAGVQRLLDATHLTMKAAVQRVIEELGRERKLTRAMLQETPLAAVAVAWRVWWAAGIDMVLCATTKGERSALRRQLDKITEDITFLLGAMGRGQQRKEEEELDQEEREVPQVPLSWVRTPSGRSCRSRRASVAALPSFRCLPLLLVTLHARDVVSSLIRSNACSVEDYRWVMQLRYSWQAQNSLLQLHAAYRSLDYGYEYNGCGSPDYVVTPLSERVLYATLAALAAHTPPLLTGECGSGRQSLMEAAAHIAGRFLLTFSLSPFTSVAALSSMLAGSLVGGSWLYLRECEQASPVVLSALASMLLNLNLAHIYTSANPVIQIGGREVSLNPGAGVILGSAPSKHHNEKSNQEEISQCSPLSHSLLGLSRPVHVAAPPARTLVFVWLLAQGHPRAQEASEAVTEVLRQVLGSFRKLAGVVGLRLHLRLTQEVLRLLNLAYSPVQAAVESFRSLVCPRLPLDSLDGVGRVLDHLVPPDSAVSSLPLVSWEAHCRLSAAEDRDLLAGLCVIVNILSHQIPTQHEESGRGQPSEEVLRRLGLKVISKQMKAVELVAKELENWSCVVVVGPPRSGKTTTITAAVRVYQRRSGALTLSSIHQYTPSTAGYKSSRNMGKMRSWIQRTPPAGHRTVRSEESSNTHDSRHLSDRETITVDEIDESNIEVLSSGRRLVDRHVYTLRPQSYSQARLLGTETQAGLFSSLLQRLTAKAIHSVVVLEGKEACQCLLRLQDLPGTLLMDSLMALPPNPNLTFIVEVCNLEEVPGWVLGRAGVVQISPDMLSLATLLPEPAILPSTPITDHCSDTSVTPRTPSIPSTPATHPEELPSSAALLDYLIYRLLHPLLQVLCDSPSSVWCYATADVIRLVESLREHKNEEVTGDCVADTVQAIVQAGRCLAHPTSLPQVHHTLNVALRKVAGENVLDSSVLEVIENLSSSDSVSEQRWDVSSSSWQPWTSPSDMKSSSTASAVHVLPTADARRLAWLLRRVIPVGLPVMVAGYAGWGKTTITSVALASLQDWVVVEVKVTPATTAEDVEATLLSHLTQTSHDTMTPASPTIFCFDDVGGLQRTSTAANYIQSVAQHQGMFFTSHKTRWMTLAHVYMMCVCTLETSEETELEEDGGWWKGWAVYHMHHDQGATSSAALSAVLKSLAPLQSHAHTAFTNATLLLAERVMPLLSPLEEPFIPSSKTALVWQVVAAMRIIPLPSVSSASFLNIFNAWLHVLISTLMLPLHSYQMQERVWEELLESIVESCSGLITELPKIPPVTLWHPGPLSPEEMPSYITQQNAATKIAKIFSEKNEVMEDEEVGAGVASHGGVCLGVSIVVAAVQDLLSTTSPPLLLCLGTATRDKQMVVALAASYLGVELMKCDGEDSALKLLEDPGGSGGAMHAGDDGGGQSCSLTPTLVHIPASVLHHPDVLKKLLNVVIKTGVGHSRIYVVTGWHVEVWPLSQELKWVTRIGRVVVSLPCHTTQHHQDLVLSLMKKDQYLQSENLNEHFGIAEFVAAVHESCCCVEEQPQYTRPDRQPSHSHHLPSVASLGHLVAIFSELLEKKKAKIHAKMEEVGQAVARVKELENHVAGLKNTHATLENSLSEANDNIQNMTTTLQQRGEDIVKLEGEASKLQEEVEAVEAAWEELDKEVEEYVQETKAPLVEITEKVATLDIHRIRKLLSRSPISAIQSVFECAVVLLGSADVSWRAVRHATQDDNFCVRLAAVCVPALTQAVVSTLADKLEHVKMTVEHMSRVSDIGGVLLQYLRCAMFFWHRYHEDVQPRQARVQTISDQAKQLHNKLVTKEKRVKGLKEEVSSLKSRLREEERCVISLRSKRAMVEEELETVLEVITHLSPHSERWREEAKLQTEMLQQVTGECLLSATCFTYLAALNPEAGEGLKDAWRKDLTARGLLHPLPEDAYQEKFRLVSCVTEVEIAVREAVQFYSSHKSLLLVRDPHYLVEDYFGSGIWLLDDGTSWLEELKEQLMAREHQCPVYLHKEHRAALESIPCILNILKDVCKSNGNKMTMVVVVVDDSCSTSPCPLCSRLTLLDLSLHHKGIVQIMAETLLRWHSPDLQQRVKQAVDAVADIRRQKEKTEAQLVLSLTSAATVTSSSELTSFMGQIKELNDVTGVLVQQEEEVEQLTEMVECQYTQAAHLAARLYTLMSTLGTLHISYNVPLSLVQDSISYRLASSNLDDASKQVSQEEILQAVTEAVFAVVETRLQQQHRVLVATLFSLARLNMFNEKEDYVKAFLIPLNLDETWLWGEIIPPEKEKKAKVDEEEDEGKEEDKKEQDMEEGKDEEKEKNMEEKEDGSEDEDTEQMKCETVEEHQDQPNEDFPSWIPSECNVKSARILGKLSEGCCSLFTPSSTPLEECAASSLLQWLAGSTSGWQQTFPAKTSLLQAVQWVVLARHLRQDQMLPAMTHLATLVLGAAALHAHPDPVSQGVGLLGRPRCTPARGLMPLIQVNVGHGVCASRAVMEAGQKGGLPYYKVTFLSLATATKQEVRRRVVMAGRRRTWLVLLDAQAAPRNLAHARLALVSLPATLPSPTVFCVVPFACHNLVSSSHSAVVVHVDRPTGLASALTAYLPQALAVPFPPHYHQDTTTTAAALTAAYVFSLLHARGERAASYWVHRPLLTETLLREAMVAAVRQGTASTGSTPDHIAWRDLAQFLAKVVVGSVIKTKLDQLVIDTIFSDHINGQVLRRQVSGQGEGPHSPVTSLSTPSMPIHSGRREAEEEQEGQKSLVSQPTHVLLHSLPTGDLMLDLSRPPSKAIATVCGHVKAKEATLLGIPEGRCLAEESRKMTIILEDFIEKPWVPTPLWVVEALLGELQASLGSPVSVVAQQVTREVTPETRAWQEEIRTWDALQDAARRKLATLWEEVREARMQPAQALVVLGGLVKSFRLHPAAATGAGRASREEAVTGRRNLCSVWRARAVVRCVKDLAREWRQRRTHLITWAEAETPPSVVRLGLLAAPGWWLSALRQAACARAHWQLHGSQVHAIPATPQHDRPPQGVYVEGACLVGGRWMDGKVVSLDATKELVKEDGEEEQCLSLVLSVSHSTPPCPAGHVWVPVVEGRGSHMSLFHALLPCHALPLTALYITL